MTPCWTIALAALLAEPSLRTSSEAPALARVVVEAGSAPGCTDEAAVLDALQAEEPNPTAPTDVQLTLTSTSGRRVRLVVGLSGLGRSSERLFVVRTRDCRLIPQLVATVWGRFVRDLPPVEGPALVDPVPRLEHAPRPGWPEQRWARGDIAVSPPLTGGGPRLGVSVGVGAGPSSLPGWMLALGYDLVPEQALGAGRTSLHGAWLGAGLAWESPAGLPGAVEVLAIGGAALAAGQGFARDRRVVLPLGRVRLAARVFLPFAASEIRPYGGLALEGSVFRVRLLANDEGARYEEPLVRLDLVLGASWGITRWP